MREEDQEQRRILCKRQRELGGGGRYREGRGPGLWQNRPHPELLPTPRAGANRHDRSLELPGALGPGLLREGPGNVSEGKEIPALLGFPGAAPDLKDWISPLQRGPRLLKPTPVHTRGLCQESGLGQEPET